MDNVNIENEQGQLLKANVPFVRLPMVGEWVAAGNQWQQVVGVFHRWQNSTPLVIIQIGQPKQPRSLIDSLAADDQVPFP